MVRMLESSDLHMYYATGWLDERDALDERCVLDERYINAIVAQN